MRYSFNGDSTTSQVSYIQVLSGTVLLRSDGCAVGNESRGRRKFPPLPDGVSYTQVATGQSHTVLLRSDGFAVACGDHSSGQCTIPDLQPGFFFVRDRFHQKDRALQLEFGRGEDAVFVIGLNLAGEEELRVSAHESALEFAQAHCA